MSYTLAEAAQACGVNRSTILRSIKAGKISGQRDESGAWSVEPVELHRVFAPIAAEATPKAVHQDAQTDALVAELRAQLAELRAQRIEPGPQKRGAAQRRFERGGQPPRSLVTVSSSLTMWASSSATRLRRRPISSRAAA